MADLPNKGDIDIRIKDPDNNYIAKVDSSGRLLVSSSVPNRTTIELNYSNASIGLLVANMWRNVFTYTIPTGYLFEITQFQSLSGNLTSSARCSKILSLGTFNTSTNVFTNGSNYTSPEFASYVEAEVTTVISATATTLTVTYTNSDGVTGRTGTIVIPASSAVGTTHQMTLQAGDIGVLDITNVTDSANPTGVVTLLGGSTLFFERIKQSDQTYNQLISRESVVLTAGDILSLEIYATNTTATNRIVRVAGILSPIGA